MSSHRVVWSVPGAAAIEEYPTPSPGEGQILIRTTVSLISPGTERAFFLSLPNAVATFPQRPGYSLVGRVEAFGEGVDGWKIGDRVAAPGPHASHVSARAAACLRVPDSLADESAVFFNLAGISMQGVRKARVEIGEPVIVIGAGLIGLLAMQLARLSGAIPTIVVDREEARLSVARTAGADAAIPSGERLSESLRSVLDADHAPVVIEATGHPSALPQALSLTRRFGRLVLLGSTRGENDGVNFYRDVHKEGITLIGAHAGTRPAHDSSPGFWTVRDDQQAALKLMAMGRFSVVPFITHRFKWDEAPKAYALLKEWNVNALGMLLDWRKESGG